ncbi:hypothetical protein C4D60_Mb01t05260 [Musa balbisiana]|uniref:Uncharacterized protein n=1 Tax=Musa balbisiana TaxID=52838 RepID=A0A4S8JLB9_MUSBA|nr:hypothetical protein C4D60_Mb01t05260 [Musa balbisiana]
MTPIQRFYPCARVCPSFGSSSSSISPRGRRGGDGSCGGREVRAAVREQGGSRSIAWLGLSRVCKITITAFELERVNPRSG